jgi:hypothetical protein
MMVKVKDLEKRRMNRILELSTVEYPIQQDLVAILLTV